MTKTDSSSIRCLGIDPGLGTLGYGVVRQEGGALISEAYGALTTPPGAPIPARLFELYAKLCDIFSAYPPDVIAVERLYFGKNVTTAEMVFQARGAVLIAAARLGVPIYEPKPAEVKLAVCGSGTADKTQVQGMVKRLLNMDETPRPDDAADALAIAITGLSLAVYDRNTTINRI